MGRIARRSKGSLIGIQQPLNVPRKFIESFDRRWINEIEKIIDTFGTKLPQNFSQNIAYII